MVDTPEFVSGSAGHEEVGRAHGRTGWRSLPFATRWSIIFGALLLALVGTVAILNSTFYSASGFVSSYLDSIAAGDTTAALAGADIERDAATSTPLIAPLPGELDRMQLLSDTVRSNGTHLLLFSFTLRGSAHRASFTVRPDAALWLVFSGWRFAESPFGTLTVTSHGDAEFTANGHRFITAGAGLSAEYAVLLPALVTLSHDSPYLVAAPTEVTVLNAATTVTAEVTPAPKPRFVAEVQKQLSALLDSCVTQTVLQPTGCPFGQDINNEVEGPPHWSMRSYPRLTIIPGATEGTWVVPPSAGTAHLVVPVRSLYDGSRSVFDRDVPFSVSYSIGFTDRGVSISSR